MATVIDIVPAILMWVVFAGLFAVVVGYVSLRRSGISFAILTLALTRLSYALACSVLTPITGGETGLQFQGYRHAPPVEPERD